MDITEEEKSKKSVVNRKYEVEIYEARYRGLNEPMFEADDGGPNQTVDSKESLFREQYT